MAIADRDVDIAAWNGIGNFVRCVLSSVMDIKKLKMQSQLCGGLVSLRASLMFTVDGGLPARDIGGGGEGPTI